MLVETVKIAWQLRASVGLAENTIQFPHSGSQGLKQRRKSGSEFFMLKAL